MRERLYPLSLRSKTTANGAARYYTIQESFRNSSSKKPEHRQRLYWGKIPIKDLLELLRAYNAAAKRFDRATADAVFAKIEKLKIELNSGSPKTGRTASVAIYKVLDSAKTNIAKIYHDQDSWTQGTRDNTKKHLENAKRWIDELISRL